MPLPDLSSPTIPIVPWDDPVIDALGFDPRSPYVETFWLGILGPSTTWLLRRIATRLDDEPLGFLLSIDESAAALGLGAKGGRNAPVVRALARSCQFNAAMLCDDGTLAVRRHLPRLSPTQVNRLPPYLRAAHDAWTDFDPATTDADQQRRRARRMALALADLEEGVEAIERRLHRWRYHPALAREAALWATARHREARAEQQAPRAVNDPGDHPWGGDAA